MSPEDVFLNDLIKKSETGEIGGGEVLPKVGVAPDYRTAWMMIGNIITNPDDWDVIADLIPRSLQKYEEYIRNKFVDYPDKIERILKNSDPSVVAALDHLTEEFNSKMDLLIQNKDLSQLKEYWEKLIALTSEK